MSADAGAFFLQASSPLQQLVPILLVTGFEETGGEFGQVIFKGLDEPFGQGWFFFQELAKSNHHSLMAFIVERGQLKN